MSMFVRSYISKYGNTSSVSIPITIVDQLKGKTEGEKKLFLCGFGVGMSWATACVQTNNMKISEIVEGTLVLSSFNFFTK